MEGRPAKRRKLNGKSDNVIEIIDENDGGPSSNETSFVDAPVVVPDSAPESSSSLSRERDAVATAEVFLTDFFSKLDEYVAKAQRSRKRARRNRGGLMIVPFTELEDGILELILSFCQKTKRLLSSLGSLHQRCRQLLLPHYRFVLATSKFRGGTLSQGYLDALLAAPRILVDVDGHNTRNVSSCSNEVYPIANLMRKLIQVKNLVVFEFCVCKEGMCQLWNQLLSQLSFPNVRMVIMCWREGTSSSGIYGGGSMSSNRQSYRDLQAGCAGLDLSGRYSEGTTPRRRRIITSVKLKTAFPNVRIVSNCPVMSWVEGLERLESLSLRLSSGASVSVAQVDFVQKLRTLCLDVSMGNYGPVEAMKQMKWLHSLEIHRTGDMKAFFSSEEGQRVLFGLSRFKVHCRVVPIGLQWPNLTVVFLRLDWENLLQASLDVLRTSVRLRIAVLRGYAPENSIPREAEMIREIVRFPGSIGSSLRRFRFSFRCLTPSEIKVRPTNKLEVLRSDSGGPCIVKAEADLFTFAQSRSPLIRLFLEELDESRAVSALGIRFHRSTETGSLPESTALTEEETAVLCAADSPINVCMDLRCRNRELREKCAEIVRRQGEQTRKDEGFTNRSRNGYDFCIGSGVSFDRFRRRPTGIFGFFSSCKVKTFEFEYLKRF